MRFCPSYVMFILVVILLGGMAMLSACGKKGPLYLPPAPPAESGPAAAPETAPEIPPPSPSR